MITTLLTLLTQVQATKISISSIIVESFCKKKLLLNQNQSFHWEKSKLTY